MQKRLIKVIIILSTNTIEIKYCRRDAVINIIINYY